MSWRAGKRARTSRCAFDGAASLQSGSSPIPLNADLTVAVLMRVGQHPEQGTLVSTRHLIGANSWALTVDQGTGSEAGFERPGFFVQNASSPFEHSPAPAALSELNTTDWYLLVITRVDTGSASWTPRFHLKNLTTDAAWEHADGTITHDQDPAAAARVWVGKDAGTSGPGWYFDGDVGLVALWDGHAMDDAEVEELSANRRTSDLLLHDPAPNSCTELIAV